MIYGTICVMHAAISFPASTHAVSLGQSRRRLLALVFAVIATTPPGRSQDPAAEQPRRYESPKGYALKIPEGWTVADESLREDIMREGMAHLKIESGLKLPEFDVVIRDESSANFFASINVVVSKGQAHASRKELDRASKYYQEGLSSVGLSIQDWSADVKRVAGRDCFLFTFAQMHGGLELKQSMYIIPGHGVNYMVTCTSLASGWDHYEPIFTSAMESFEVTGVDDTEPSRRYESPKGYALKIPEGWTVADESLREEIIREGMAQFKTESGLKRPEYDVVIRDESSANFFASINVIISKERPRASQKELDKASNAIQEGCRSMGVSIQNFSAGIKRVAGRDSYFFAYSRLLNGLEVKLTQYMIPGHGVSYTVTCASLASDWDRYEPIFTSAMESFEVTGAGLGWWKRMPTWARDGAVGAVVGLLVMTVLEIRKRRRARLAPQGTQELSEVDDSRRGDSAERSG